MRIEGLLIYGGTPDHFANKVAWDCKYDVLFGDVGVNIRRSRGVRIRDNVIKGFFAGLHINNRNLGGVLAPAPMDGIPSLNPGTKPGLMGAHVIEHNVFHHNWWVAYDEAEWGLGSTFRFKGAGRTPGIPCSPCPDLHVGFRHHWA